MGSTLKDLDNSGGCRFKYFSFSDHLSRLDINPLNRSDFFGELCGDSNDSLLASARHTSGIVCEVSVSSENNVTVHNAEGFSATACSKVQNAALSALPEEEVDRRVYLELKSSYFSSALTYWKARNLSKAFLNCYRQLYPITRSLPQILHHLQDIVNILLDEIENTESLAREPAYHLLAVLARDLRQEFAPYLPLTFTRLLRVLNPTDTFSIEMTFFTLGLLFKFLFRVILAQLHEHLPFYKPALTHKFYYVRSFAAESLSFLLRKQSLEDMPGTLDVVFSLLDQQQPQVTEYQTDDNARPNQPEYKSEKQNSNQSIGRVEHDNRTDSSIDSDATNSVEDSTEAEQSSTSDGEAEIVTKPNATISAAYEKSCNSASPFGNAGTQPPIALAETLGVLLFETVKGVNGTFTAKFDLVVRYAFDRLQSVSKLITHSDAFLSQNLGTSTNLFIVIRSFFIYCRNHTGNWDSEACNRLLNCLSDVLSTSVEGTVNAFDASLGCSSFIALLPQHVSFLQVLLRVITDLLCIRPSPRGVPTRFCAKVQEAFCSLLDHKIISATIQLSTELLSAYFKLFQVILQVFIKLWSANPLFTTTLLLPSFCEQCPDEKQDVLLKAAELVMQHQATSGATMALSCLITLLRQIIGYLEATLSSGTRDLPTKERALAKTFALRLAGHVAVVLSSQEIVLDFQTLLDNKRLVFDLLAQVVYDDQRCPIQSDLAIDWPLLISAALNCCAAPPRVLSSRFSEVAILEANATFVELEEQMFTYFNFLKTLIFDSILPQFTKQTLIETFNTSAPFASHVAAWLEYCCQSCLKVDFNTLQANSSALRRITLHLALLHRVICLTGVLSSCDLPSLWLNLRSSFYASRSSSAQMCAEQDTPSLPWSCNVFCVVLDLWSRLLSLQFHTGGTKAEAKLFLSEAPKWYECFAEILRDLHLVASWNPDDIKHSSTIEQLGGCILLSFANASRKTRSALLDWLQRLPLFLRHRILMLRVLIVPISTVKTCSSFSPLYVSLDMTWQIVFRDVSDTHQEHDALNQTFFDGLLERTRYLDTLENNLLNEREKTDAIARLADDIVELQRSYGNAFWLGLLASSALLRQLSEKFLTLWSKTCDAITHILVSEKNDQASRRKKNPGAQNIVTGVSKNSSPDSSYLEMPIFRLFIGSSLVRAVQLCVVEAWAMPPGPAQLCSYTNKKAVLRGRTGRQHKSRGALGKHLLSTATAEADAADQLLQKNYSAFRSSYRDVDTVSSYQAENTDPQTLHNWCCKLLAAVFSQMGQIDATLLQHDKISSERHIVFSWIETILSYALAQANALCESPLEQHTITLAVTSSASADLPCSVPSLINDLPVLDYQKQAMLSSPGALSRLLDFLRFAAVIKIQSSQTDASCEGTRDSCRVALDRFRRLSNLIQTFVDYCAHRVVLIPDRTAQSLCLKIAASSTGYCDLAKYITYFEDVIKELKLSRSLLPFSVYQDNGVVNKDHRPVVVPFFIRLLMSKLSRKAPGNSKHAAAFAFRRKAIFRFLTQLPPDEIPLVLTTLFRAVFHIEDTRNSATETVVTDETKRETLLQSMLAQSAQHNASVDFQCLSAQMNGAVDVGSYSASWVWMSRYRFTLDQMILNRHSMLAAILTTVDQMVHQMRLTLSSFSTFLVQFLLSLLVHLGTLLLPRSCPTLVPTETHILPEHCTAPETASASYAAPSDRLRSALRKTFRVLARLTSIYPSYAELWDNFFLQVQPILIAFLTLSLQSGSVSVLLNFVCQLAQTPASFPLLASSLRPAFPMLCRALVSQPVITTIARGLPTPPIVPTVFTFFLRLCRGGNISIEDATRAARAERKRAAHTTSTARNRKRYCSRGNDDSENDDDDDDHGNADDKDTKQGAFDLEAVCFASSLAAWKKQLEADCNQGRALVQPFIGELLTSFVTLLETRRSAEHLRRTHQASEGNRRRTQVHIVSNDELDVLLELSRVEYQKDVPATCKLISLLLYAFPQSKSLAAQGANGPRQKLIYCCLTDLLAHLHRSKTCIDEAVFTETLEELSSTLRSHLQWLQDVELRQTLCALLVTCGLIQAGCPDPVAVMKDIANTIPHGATPGSTPGADTSLLVEQWLPSAIIQKGWVDKTSCYTWNVSVSLLLFGLSALRTHVVSAEPDYDLHCTLLTEIIEHLLVPKRKLEKRSFSTGVTVKHLCIPPEYQQWLVIQCLYVVQAEGVDLGVRSMAVRLICTITDRIYAIVALRKKLIKANPNFTVPDTDEAQRSLAKTEDEWEQCRNLFRNTFYSVITTLRGLLRSQHTQGVRSGLEILAHFVRRLAPLRCWLPFITGPTSFFSEPKKDVNFKRNMALIEGRFHFDLSSDKLVPSTSTETALDNTFIDVFSDLLHVQKRCRARGLQLLSQGVKKRLLTRGTAKSVCLPLAMMALLQPDAAAKDAMNLGLAERAIDCLGHIAQIVSWPECLKLIQRLIKSLNRYPSRETIIIRAICSTLKAVDAHINDAVAQYLATAPETDQATAKSLNGDDALPVTAATQFINFSEVLDANSGDVPAAHTDNESSICSEEQETLTAVVSNSAGQRTAKDQIALIQRCIRFQLLPALRRIGTSTKTVASQSTTGVHDMGAKSAPLKQQANVTLVQPRIIAAQIQMIKHLTPSQFHAEVPRLIQLLTTCLGSRDPASRRKARIAVCSVVTTLGPAYMGWILRLLAQGLTKGSQVTVFTFSAAAALMELLYGGAQRGKALLRAPLLIPPHSIDDCIATLLPLVGQEVARFCDPARPEFHAFREATEHQSTVKRAGIDEQRYFKSGDLLLMMCRVASFKAISMHIFKYLYNLLTNSADAVPVLSDAASCTKKYQNMMRILFEQAILGVYANPGVTTFAKVQFAYRLLRLYIVLEKNRETPGHLENKSHSNTSKLALRDHGLHHKIGEGDDDNDFFSAYLSGSAHESSMASEVPKKKSDLDRLKRFEVQPGAATGRSAEQVLKKSQQLDIGVRGTVIALTGLRLFFMVQGLLQKDSQMALSTAARAAAEPSEPITNEDLALQTDNLSDAVYLQKLFHACSLYVIDCFCGHQDDLTLWAAKCLLKLLTQRSIRLEKHGRRIAATVLRVFQNSGGNSSRSNSEMAKNLMAVCTRVLSAALLLDTGAAAWFHRLVEDGNVLQQPGKTQTKKDPQTFKTALLMQIRASLDDPRLRISALQLFRSVILLKDKHKTLQDAEHSALVYQCVDEIAVMLVQHSGGLPKLITLCGSIYVDFLMRYPMPERIQKKRINFLVRNLVHVSYYSRQAVLSVIYELLNRLPADILSNRYSSIFTFALVIRLAKEDHQETRRIVRAVLKKVIISVPHDGARTQLLLLTTKAFLSTKNSVHRAALTEVFELAVSCITPSVLPRPTTFINIVSECLSAGSVRDDTLLTELLPHTIAARNADVAFRVPESDWALTFAFVRFFERFIQAYASQLSLIIAEPGLSTSFIALWRYFATSCSLHPHPWIKMGTLRTLTKIMLTMVNEPETSAAATYGTLFSAATLPGLTQLDQASTNGAKAKVTPLTALLWHFVNWSRDVTAENLTESANCLANGIVALCQTILTYPNFIKESDDVPTRDDPVDDLAQRSAVYVKGNKKVGDAKEQLSPHSAFGVSNLGAHTKLLDADCETGGQKSDVELNHAPSPPAVKPEDDTLADSDELQSAHDDASDEESLLNALPDVSLAPDLIQAAEDADANIVDSVSSCSFTYPSISTLPVDPSEFLRVSRIRWTVGRLTWSVKRGAAQLCRHVVRICMALRILKSLAALLPSQVLLSGDTPFLESILEGVFLCASFTRRKDTSKHEVATMDLNTIATTVHLAEGTDSKASLHIVASFAENALAEIEKAMAAKQITPNFFSALQRVRTAVGKKRLQRKQELRREKTRNPQEASLRRIRRHEKKKLLNKKRIQKFRALRGAA